MRGSPLAQVPVQVDGEPPASLRLRFEGGEPPANLRPRIEPS
jgi:hypothetical protein